MRAQAIEKPKLTIAVGGKNLLYYLPLTIAETQASSRPRAWTSPSPISPAAQRARAGGRRQRRRGLGAFEHTPNMQSKGQRCSASCCRARAADRAGINPKTMPGYKSPPT